MSATRRAVRRAGSPHPPAHPDRVDRLAGGGGTGRGVGRAARSGTPGSSRASAGRSSPGRHRAVPVGGPAGHAAAGRGVDRLSRRSSAWPWPSGASPSGAGSGGRSASWIEVFRAIPLLALIVFAYIGLPKYDIRISRLLVRRARPHALQLRGPGRDLPGRHPQPGTGPVGGRGQPRASRWPTTMRLVILPQALRRMLPSYVSQIVTIVKDTSLGFVVAAEEFLSRSRVVGNFRGGRYLVPALITAAIVYLIVNLTLSRFAHRLEGRVGRKAGGVVAIDPELALAGPRADERSGPRRGGRFRPDQGAPSAVLVTGCLDSLRAMPRTVRRNGSSPRHRRIAGQGQDHLPLPGRRVRRARLGRPCR